MAEIRDKWTSLTLAKSAISDLLGAFPREDLIEVLATVIDRHGIHVNDLVVSPISLQGEIRAKPAPTSFQWHWYKVVLDAVGPNRLHVVRLIRTHSDCSLHDALQCVRDVEAVSPMNVSGSLSKLDAEALKAKFEAEGATCHIDGVL